MATTIGRLPTLIPAFAIAVGVIVFWIVGYTSYKLQWSVDQPAILAASASNSPQAESQARIVSELLARQLAVRATQFMVTYSIGLLCIISGIVFCWYGVNGDFEMEASGKGAAIKMKTAQVGLIVLAFGIVVVLVMLFAPTAKIGGGASGESGLNGGSSMLLPQGI